MLNGREIHCSTARASIKKYGLSIRGLEIYPPLFLAPMAGLTHSALRTTILACGGVGLLSTEMLAAWRLPDENVDISPYLARTAEEYPLSYQLLLNDAALVEPAMQVLRRLQADAVDINLGCSAPRVRRAGGGSGLLATPRVLRAIIRRARKATDGPLSAKIRLGDGRKETLQPLCQMLGDEGLDMLCIHARLQKESFSRKPRWAHIAEIKQWLDIPIIANGGVDSVRSAQACFEQSQADGIMIGRAAACKPWIFAQIAKALFQDTTVCLEYEKPLLYASFCQGIQERFRPERRLGRLKEFTHYFATNYTFGHYLASRVQASRNMQQAVRHALHFFSVHDPTGYRQLQEQKGQWISSCVQGG